MPVAPSNDRFIPASLKTLWMWEASNSMPCFLSSAAAANSLHSGKVCHNSMGLLRKVRKM